MRKFLTRNQGSGCGVEQVKVYSIKGVPTRQGRGLFAAAVMRELALLPAEEEGRLNNPALRENFVERVFAYHRWQRLARRRR